ncbi:MAG: DUF4150 domain-containing protein, partial [Myxococcales bacterium]|nr:DUF4150 domain-containing protein [Myxococcales bacterium]
MATESDNRKPATKGSAHMCVAPVEVSLVPAPAPGPPVPTPFPITACSRNVEKPDAHLSVGNAPVLLANSSMTVDPPANQPGTAGGDVVTHAHVDKADMTQGSSTTTVGGQGLACTGHMVAVNVPAPNMAMAQCQVPLVEGGDMANGEGDDDEDKHPNAATSRAVPANTANASDDPNASSCNPAPASTGHPVAIASGFVIDDSVDLSLPGVVPFTLLRSYTSQRSAETGLLGKGGWVLSVEQWVTPRTSGSGKPTLAVRLADGRDAYCEPIGPGEHYFHRREQLELYAERDPKGGVRYRLWDLKTRRWTRYEAQIPGGKARLTSIADAYGNAITLEYQGDTLVRLVDTARRELRFLYRPASGHPSTASYLARIEVWASPPPPPIVPGTPPTPPIDPTLQTWVDYTQDTSDCLASASDALGHTERYRYDDQRRMVQVTLQNGTSFYYLYEETYGRCIKTWGDGGLHTVELDRRAPPPQPPPPPTPP